MMVAAVTVVLTASNTPTWVDDSLCIRGWWEVEQVRQPTGVKVVQRFRGQAVCSTF